MYVINGSLITCVMGVQFVPGHYSEDMVHVKCAKIERENHIIYHPSHPHPLQSVTSETIICTCDACGKEHRGIFYLCTTCFHHSIHVDCAFLPRKLHIQHTHPLIISYSYPVSIYDITCRICREPFDAPFCHKYLWSLCKNNKTPTFTIGFFE